MFDFMIGFMFWDTIAAMWRERKAPAQVTYPPVRTADEMVASYRARGGQS